MASTLTMVVGRSPRNTAGGIPLKSAFVRAIRTLIQGIAAAFPAAGPGSAILSASYWQTFAYSCLAAVITAVVSFLNNIAQFLPEDGSQAPT
jgi:hypothetical protein